MTEIARRITLDEWDRRYAELKAAGLREPDYGGPLGRHVADGDLRLLKLEMDDSPAALRLWNFLLTEEIRLAAARKRGQRIVGPMKDLGTVPVMAFSLDRLVAFYPDGAWWIPCLMEHSAGLLTEADAVGIARANVFRRRLDELRRQVFSADLCPLPALETLIAEMLAVHFCSDQREAIAVLGDLVAETRRRVRDRIGVLGTGAVRVFWVNPVADLRVMNLLEDAGGRVCGTEFLFCHALDPIPEDLPPMEALARSALADPMVGSPADRAERIVADPVVFTGGVALVPGMDAALKAALDRPVTIAPDPQLTAALGAALIASDGGSRKGAKTQRGAALGETPNEE